MRTLVLVGAALLFAVVRCPRSRWSPRRAIPRSRRTKISRSRSRSGRREPHFGSPLVDHLPMVAGDSDAEGRARLSHRRARQAHVLRRHPEVLPRAGQGDAAREGRDDRQVGRRTASSSSSGSRRTTTSRTCRRTATTSRRSPIRAACPPTQIKQLIATTKPHYHLMGGLHSGETGPSEMLMELAYRLATETSPLITQIRDNVIVSITPVADPDGRDRNVDWFYRARRAERCRRRRCTAAAACAVRRCGCAGAGGGDAAAQLPYWGKYVYHDNNRDINLSQVSMRAIIDWYFTAHPPIMHDLHEAQPLMYTYSGGPPQNPNLDPILFAELPFFSNWELAQMTKWGMPGVYTHAFMDGWSPGYLGSVAYNHNGMMRMYETQSGRESGRRRSDGKGATRRDSAAAVRR